MLKHIGLLSAAIASLTVGAIPAGAQSGTPVYNYYYYDENGNHVGTMVGRCYANGTVRYTLTGIQTPDRHEVLRFYCGPYGPEPIE